MREPRFRPDSSRGIPLKEQQPTIDRITPRGLVPTEKIAMPGGFIYDIYNEDDGFRHRLRYNAETLDKSFVGEWQGYTMPATLPLHGATYFVITDFFGGSLGDVQPGKLYKITEVVVVPGVVTNA